MLTRKGIKQVTNESQPPIEKMNICADKLADPVYTEHRILGLNRSSLDAYGTWQIYKQGHRVTGHWRNQIKEELRLDNTEK